MMGMRAAGVHTFGGPIIQLDLADPRPLRPDEVLIDVAAAGVAAWDDLTRTGSWDLGRPAPLALGVQAAGTVAALGASVSRFAVGDRVMMHSAPLRAHGTWAPQHIAAVGDVARLPDELPWDLAAILPVPALTAEQVLRNVLGVTAGETVLIHGASGVTGTVLVQLARYLSARVLATGGAHRGDGMLDGRAPDWPERLGTRVDAAVNAVPGGAATALRAVRDGGRLATITSDRPAAERNIAVEQVYVAADGNRLTALGRLAAIGVIQVPVAPASALVDAAATLDRSIRGAGGQAMVLHPDGTQT